MTLPQLLYDGIFFLDVVMVLNSSLRLFTRSHREQLRSYVQCGLKETQTVGTKIWWEVYCFCALQNYCFSMPSRVETVVFQQWQWMYIICKSLYYCIIASRDDTWASQAGTNFLQPRDITGKHHLGKRMEKRMERLCPHDKAETIAVTLYGWVHSKEVHFNLMIQGIYGSWSFLPKLILLVRKNIRSFLSSVQVKKAIWKLKMSQI